MRRKYATGTVKRQPLIEKEERNQIMRAVGIELAVWHSQVVVKLAFGSCEGCFPVTVVALPLLLIDPWAGF